MNTNPFTRRVEAALTAIAAGKFVVVADSAAQILTDLGLTTVRLMRNDPAKFGEFAA
jgi:hypothetical protein